MAAHGYMLHVHYTVDPSNVDEFFKHLRAALKHVTAEEKCTFFETTVKRDTGEIRLTEGWAADLDYLMNVQIKKDYYKPYFEAIEPLLTKPRVFELFERLPPEWTTIKASHTADSSFLTSTVFKRLPVEVTPSNHHGDTPLHAIYIFLTVNPSKVDEFLVHLQGLSEHVTAEEKCTFYEITVKQETGEIRLTEGWAADVDYLMNVQVKKDYYSPYFEAMGPMMTKPRVVEIFERLPPEWTTVKADHTAQ
ncbi:antibiotic biosynthesis monooxygenase [Moniliophthora roreri MCA 2997]|uniref:Antibiotic biosynthesis monooxygenase n=1 Tax=Moniliophthora roreri (strain MCA 2997) TaxID=1381753 RepID=V2XFP0_MONRO|nr:antibiotic biosynthesis monooxygenase [Moniliophthora roreri MCA 2997]